MAKRDLILHNFWWKVTSLLLAIVVWFVVYDTSPSAAPMSPMRFPKHPLAIMRDSTDKRAIRITPTEVDVIVSTPLVARTRLIDSDIQTFIDLNEVDPKTKSAPIRVYVPRGVRLEQITPDHALVEVIE